MNPDKRTLRANAGRDSGAVPAVVATPLADIVSVALLSSVALASSVAALCCSEGTPLAAITAAERACVAHACASERDACAREWLATARRGSTPGRDQT